MMDSLIVDLDKVLDDFEAEEFTTNKNPGNVPSEYANFLAKNDDRSWEEVGHAPAESAPNWKLLNKEDNLSYIDYGEPYEPAGNFDLSEADFSPSVSTKTETITPKLNNVLTNGHDRLLSYEHENYDHKKFEKGSLHLERSHGNMSMNKPGEMSINKSGEVSMTNGLVRMNGYDNSPVALSMHNVNNSQMIDLHGCYNENLSSDSFETSGQSSHFEDTYCKLPIQVVDIFTPVSEEQPHIPSTTYQHNTLKNESCQSPEKIEDITNTTLKETVQSTTKNVTSEITVSSDKKCDIEKVENASLERIHNDLTVKVGTLSEKRNNEPQSNFRQLNNDNKKADEGYDSYDCLSKELNSSSPVKKVDQTRNLVINSGVATKLSLQESTVHDQMKDLSFDFSEQTTLKKIDVEENFEKESNFKRNDQFGATHHIVGFDHQFKVEDDDIDDYLKDVEKLPSNSVEIDSSAVTSSISSVNSQNNNSFPPEYSKIEQIKSSDTENKHVDVREINLKEHSNEQNNVIDSNIDFSAMYLQADQISNNKSSSQEVLNLNQNLTHLKDRSSDEFQVDLMNTNIQHMQMPSVEMGGARPKEMYRPKNLIEKSTHSYVENDVAKSNCKKTNSEKEFQGHDSEINISWQCDSNNTNTICNDNGGDTSEEPPVMRRNIQSVNQSDNSRPHSWGPSGSDTVPIPQQKRPNSLNLPQRGDLGMSGERTQVPYTFPYPSEDTDTVSPEAVQENIQNEEVQAVGGEPVEASGASGLTPLQDAAVHEDISTQPNTEMILGQNAPMWIPDNEAPVCMGCEAKFTFTKRRHHCRACGKVFCSACCSLKSRLHYMENKEARVCMECHRQITIAELSSQTSGSPNPNNPSEYCSVIPPSQQARAHSQPPSVLVPASVLKREGSNKQSNEGKHVMFSDGIRPGGDLTELDGSDAANRLPLRRSARSQKKVEKGSPDTAHQQVTRKLRVSESRRHMCLIPEHGLPPIIKSTGVKGDFVMEEAPEIDKIMAEIRDVESEPVIFALNANLFVLVKIISLDCCVNRTCWCFTTKGMCNVGQDEIVFVLEVLPNEETIPMDILRHFFTVYEEAGKGNTVTHMGHTIFNQSFLDSREHGGILYIRPTFQCLHKLLLPSPPYVFGILLQKWETPWAKVFPLRLLLRLGAEYRYYPCPLISVRNRKPVFFEIGHTIMNLLADFRNFQYMLPQIKGVHIHMEDKKTAINFPRNRYEELMKVVNNSNEHVMALGASFSLQADSHLVCIQNDDGNYQTQAINIQNKPRKVTGASFVVFNGALKTSSGLKAKSSIVEDGLMVQITPESMVALKQALRDMNDYTIECGSITATSPDEVVSIVWGEDDKNSNIGVRSPIDGMSMDGIDSIHIPNATDYVGEKHIIRWTDVFFIQNKDSGSTRWEPVDLSRLAETLSNASCIALTPHLDKLKEASLTKLGLRVIIEIEKVGYEIGANGDRLPDLYMNDLDNELIPVIHSAASQNRGGAIILELIFHVLD